MTKEARPVASTIQDGAKLYGFIDDRLDEKLREEHPHGREPYADAWRKAHRLQQAHANALSAGDAAAAEHHLQALRDVASEWAGHSG
ncbi:hypothetical protein OK006_9383 [Actinobacteria bacterium OK006]|nr:hypothetical protein OK006_9383 [Actinobacteria bacterium OK006]